MIIFHCSEPMPENLVYILAMAYEKSSKILQERHMFIRWRRCYFEENLNTRSFSYLRWSRRSLSWLPYIATLLQESYTSRCLSLLPVVYVYSQQHQGRLLSWMGISNSQKRMSLYTKRCSLTLPFAPFPTPRRFLLLLLSHYPRAYIYIYIDFVHVLTFNLVFG